jgi:DNA-directed RNA polymerase subunit RPC12/RpoP
MSEVKFVCPKCNQSLEGDESVRGQTVECPSCHTQIVVPSGQKEQNINQGKDGSNMNSAFPTISIQGNKVDATRHVIPPVRSAP